MYAVIFRAEINDLDESYSKTVDRMRELALNEYGCIEFCACSEGNREMAISYWPDKESIQAWKNNLEHQRAQALGRSRWYKSYQVQVVEILKRYGSGTEMG